MHLASGLAVGGFFCFRYRRGWMAGMLFHKLPAIRTRTPVMRRGVKSVRAYYRVAATTAARITMSDYHRLRVPDDARLIRRICMPFCEVRQYRDNYLWCWTEFADGSGYGATPDYSIEGARIYAERAARVGCVDVDDYCYQHEFAHSFLCWQLNGTPSPILWDLAHKRQPVRTAAEESLVIHFQQYINGKAANDIMEGSDDGVNWPELREKANMMLARSADPVRDPVATAMLR